jgi:hypothetical protein
MIGITNTTELIRFHLNASHTTNPVEAFFTGRNIAAASIMPINFGVDSNGTSDVTLMSSPALSEQKEMHQASIINLDTTNKTVTVEYFNGSVGFPIFVATIAPNEMIHYDSNGWKVFATSGAVKQSINQGANAPNPSGLLAVVLASDVVNNNAVANTIQDVTGLSASFLANKMYYFKFVIWYTSAATSTGSRWAVNASAGLATNLSMISEYSATSTTTTRNANVQAFDFPAASNASSATTVNNMAIMEGYFRPTADCTFIARFASEISNSAITAKAGSVLYYQQTD